MVTKYTVCELVEDLSAQSIVSALTRLSCAFQLPTIIYMDRHSSNIHALNNAELHMQVNGILMKTKGLQYNLAPVGAHHTQGKTHTTVYISK